jgi:hypothetical protein
MRNQHAMKAWKPKEGCEAMTASTRWIPIAAVALSAASAPVACAAAGDNTARLPEDTESPDAALVPSSDAGAGDARSDAEKPTEVAAGTCSASGLCVASIPVDGTIGLTSVWGASTSDVWAGGTNGTVLHYDGAAWEKGAIEPEAMEAPFTIRSVWSGRAGDVWMADGRKLWHASGWKGPSETKWSSVSFSPYEPAPAAVTGVDAVAWLSRRTRMYQRSSGPWLMKCGEWADGGPLTVEEVGSTPYASISLTAMSASRPDELWAVGSAVVDDRIRSRAFRAHLAPGEDGAASWQFDEHLLLTNDEIFGVWGDDTAVWVVGGHGTLRRMPRSQVPNRVFERVSSPVSTDLYGVFGFGPEDVWMVGEEGTVLHWDGATFTRVATPYDELPNKPRFFSVWGTSPADLWIAGQGTMLHLQKEAR